MILITGATGLVGSHLLKELAKTNKNIVALYHTTKPNTAIQHLAIWKQVDILDISALEDAMKDVEQVYHCAALVSFTKKDKEHLQQLNIEGTKNIVNACLSNNVQKLVHVSSVATLDRFKNCELIDEKITSNNTSENSEYAKSKITSEMEIWRGIGEGLNAVIVNPSIILGAGNWHTGSTAIFKNSYTEFPWYTNGSNGFVDVIDVAKAMIVLMNSQVTNERFIINGYNLSYKNLFDSIAKQLKKKPPQKLATPFLSAIAWRIELIKSWFKKASPLLTKETAATAQKLIAYDNSKLLNIFPEFSYTPFETCIERVCSELSIKYKL